MPADPASEHRAAGISALNQIIVAMATADQLLVEIDRARGEARKVIGESIAVTAVETSAALAGAKDEIEEQKRQLMYAWRQLDTFLGKV